jgi:hypothetical protein
MKFFPYGIGRDTQTSVTYDTVKEHILQYIHKTYKNGQNIAVSLRDLEKKDLTSLMPMRGQYIEDSQVENTKEQARMDIMYQAEKSHMDC